MIDHCEWLAFNTLCIYDIWVDIDTTLRCVSFVYSMGYCWDEMSSYALCAVSTVVISINYHYKNVISSVGCGITAWVMVVDRAGLKRNGEQNFSQC